MTRSRGSWEGEGSWGRRGSWRRREEEEGGGGRKRRRRRRRIPETEYYQKMSSHAQIRPQGAEKQQS